MNQPLRWGICGCGGIAPRMAKALALVPGNHLQAVAARDQARASVFAAQHGSPTAYGSYVELIADPTVDVVYVATVHNHHYPVVRQALEAGKAVLCEKPLVMTADQAKQMFPAVEGIPAGIDLFALHAADGTPLALTDSRQAALGHAMGDELEIASLH